MVEQRLRDPADREKFTVDDLARDAITDARATRDRLLMLVERLRAAV